MAGENREVIAFEVYEICLRPLELIGPTLIVTPPPLSRYLDSDPSNAAWSGALRIGKRYLAVAGTATAGAFMRSPARGALIGSPLAAAAADRRFPKQRSADYVNARDFLTYEARFSRGSRPRFRRGEGT